MKRIIEKYDLTGYRKSHHTRINLIMCSFVFLLLTISSFSAIVQLVESQVTDIVVPEVKLSYKSDVINMLPFIYSKNSEVQKIGFPELPDNYEPKITIERNETLQINTDEIKPTKLNAFIIDYEADTNELYPLEIDEEGKIKISDSTPSGAKTLEVRATFENGEQVTYTTLVFIN